MCSDCSGSLLVLSYTTEAALSHSEALEILKVVKESQESPSVTSRGKSALDLLRNEVEYGCVVTFSSQVRNGVAMQMCSLRWCCLKSALLPQVYDRIHS